MIDSDCVVNTRKVFSSTNEDEIYESMIEKYVDGTLDSGGRFWGRLEAFNERKLFIRGERGQAIIIKRRKISRLVTAATLDKNEPKDTECQTCDLPVNEDGAPPCYVTGFCPRTEWEAYQAVIDREYDAQKGI
jgi:hypothetical protein